MKPVRVYLVCLFLRKSNILRAFSLYEENLFYFRS